MYYRKNLNSINIYSVKEDSLIGEHTEPVNNYDLLTVVMIYTAVDFMSLQDDVIKMLSVLLSRNLDAQERMNILETDFNIAMTEEVKQEVDEMCNLRKGVREDVHKETALEMLKGGEKLSKIIKYSTLAKDAVLALAKENGLEVVVG